MTLRQTDKCLLRVGVLSSHSRLKINGIARYQWMIIDILEYQGVRFKLFDLRETESAIRDKFSNTILAIWRFLRLCINVNRSSVDIFWGGAHKLPLWVKKDVPCVLTIHDLVWKKAGSTMPVYRRLVESLVMPYSLKRANIIIAVSQNTANDILEYFPKYKDKVRVIPLAAFMGSVFDQNKLNKTLHLPDKSYVLFVGTLEPRKNLLRLLDAYSKLPHSLKDEYKLVIAGDKGWGKVPLEDEIERKGLTGCVSLLGRVTDDELICLYRNAYCLAMPSLYEGFGLPIVEAQSFGVPVITSSTSSMPEVAADGAIYVDPLDVVSISNALQCLLENGSTRDDLSRRSLKNSQRFSWEQTAKLTLDAFNEAFDQRSKI